MDKRKINIHVGGDGWEIMFCVGHKSDNLVRLVEFPDMFREHWLFCQLQLFVEDAYFLWMIFNSAYTGA